MALYAQLHVQQVEDLLLVAGKQHQQCILSVFVQHIIHTYILLIIYNLELLSAFFYSSFSSNCGGGLRFFIISSLAL